MSHVSKKHPDAPVWCPGSGASVRAIEQDNGLWFIACSCGASFPAGPGAHIMPHHKYGISKAGR